MPTPDRLTADVGIIGGGPAGSTAAHRLAALGYDVCLLEREAFPRPRVGESLPAGILPLLDTLGVRERVEGAGFLRPRAALVRWAEPSAEQRVHPGPPGLQVDRGRFDALLLDGARAAGARVLQPATVGRRLADDGKERTLPIRIAGSHATLSARYIIDATGRGGVVPGRHLRASAPTLALYGYWRDTAIHGPETRVDSGDREWYWCAPLAGGTVAAAVFVDPKRVSSNKARDIEALYRDLLTRSELVRGCLDGELISAVAACDASCVHAAQPVGDRFIRVGDACFAMDPISSQGVQSAIVSGLQAAVVVNTVLARPENAALAMSFYQDRQSEKLVRHCRASAGFYAEKAAMSDQPFWHDRAAGALQLSAAQPATDAPAGGCPVGLSDAVELVDVPSIEGDFVVSLPGIAHPALDGPMTFLGSTPVRPLLDAMAPDMTTDDLIGAWSRLVPPGDATALMSWLWSRQIVVGRN
jgi:flavin-dependent dehydrogenase